MLNPFAMILFFMTLKKRFIFVQIDLIGFVLCRGPGSVCRGGPAGEGPDCSGSDTEQVCDSLFYRQISITV